MTGPRRLPNGGRIDRSRVLSFCFDGRRYTGYPGDTLASALLANGVRLVGRSFKYHRPRGVMTAGAEEPNALVLLEPGRFAEPNLRATEIELYDGLVAESVNRWPSLRVDLGAAAGLASGLFVAGFYYKTFMWPPSWWNRVYAPVIRRMAGLARAPSEPDPELYEHRHVHCDILVVGAGPAGIAAAHAAAASGAHVILADERPRPGGTLLDGPAWVGDEEGAAWAERMLAEMSAQVLPRSTAFGYYDHNFVALAERLTEGLSPAERGGRPRQRVWHIRARRVALATGAHERPLVFPGNDRPGVMLAGAVSAYIHRYAVLPGGRAVFLAGDDSVYAAAREFARHGGEVAALVDLRTDSAAEANGLLVLRGAVPLRTFGRGAVTGIEVEVNGTRRRIACDMVAMGGGWNPAVHLFSQSRGTLRWDDESRMFVPGLSAQAERSVGAAGGRFDLEGCIAQGAEAGVTFACELGFEASALSATPAAPAAQPGVLPVPPKSQDKAFVDFQNDVTAADVALARREGMQSVEHLKRWTTLGMATDQGKTSNINGLALMATGLGRPPAEVGHTTFRPPYTPVTFGALAGRHVGALADPVCRTPMQDWHETAGAVFEPVGQWLRARYYPQLGENMREAVARECRAVREGAGILDASTLGKIDIRGSDAAEFLNRIYVNGWKTLGVGRCRYGLMLGEDGMVFDDGVTTRIGEHRYLMTTTSGNAAAVLEWLETWLQTEWPTLRVYCTSVTEQWGTITVSGPQARALVEPLVEDIDLDPAAFPFMSMREGWIGGAPGRIFRIAFTGELSYELNLPWRQALPVWQRLVEAGAVPYGTEAMHVLRAEKGFIVVGHETDGTVTPVDLGMERMVSSRKDFIGRRSLARPDCLRPDRKQLVGLLPEDPLEVLQEGAQILEAPRAAAPVPMLGHVTSSYWSAAMERGFALALVRGGRSRHGDQVWASATTGDSLVRIVDPVFYDPEGTRLDG
ncbi:MAG: sarcosine oxidase subunit alpha family protein [Alphaproteobacteria bacterium]|nr:sarcosine oxidase subunit alpha family protein [Alphaproteobacteria bacterium]MCY4318535.1 sarcosine oxidase subunit alpha family protein [Alphaproteobacteria bacterium]